MKLKDYFDVSSIHGLGHINSQKSFAKLFWIVVVFCGFLGAGILVSQSFEDWGSNPISTVIETKPILESQFPDVVVCPPENTFTNLNFDLMRAETIDLEEKTRESLVNLTTEMILDEEFFAAYDVQNNIFEANKYRNWFTGFTLAALSESNLVHVTTSSEAGSFTSPFYGDPFVADKFQIEADFTILISPPKNISTYRKGRGYDSFCVKITKDTSDSSIKEVIETVKWYQGYNYGLLSDGFRTETRCFRGKEFKQSILRARSVRVAFERVFSKRAFESWTKKRFTGMTVNWYYTDDEGKQIDIVPEPKYLNEEVNKNFITLVRLVETQLSEDLWRRFKRFKVEQVEANSFSTAESCEFSTTESTSTFDNKKISKFLEDIIEELGIEKNETESLNPEEIDDTSLNVAAAMFIYLAKCPAPTTKSVIGQVKNFFKIASTATIWEAVINVYKNSLTRKPKNISFSMDAMEGVILILGDTLNSSLALLEAFSVSQKDLLKNKNENVLFKSLSVDVLGCLQNMRFCQKAFFEDIINSNLMGSHPVHMIREAFIKTRKSVDIFFTLKTLTLGAAVKIKIFNEGFP